MPSCVLALLPVSAMPICGVVYSVPLIDNPLECFLEMLPGLL